MERWICEFLHLFNGKVPGELNKYKFGVISLPFERWGPYGGEYEDYWDETPCSLEDVYGIWEECAASEMLVDTR
jgi:hypothetical protein